LGFAGEYKDRDSGLIYLRARHYHPQTAQFLTRDPLATLSGQPYLYAGGNPINSIDPLGLFPSLGEIGMAFSNAAAATLDLASFGYSSKLAGSALGFDADCADFHISDDVWDGVRDTARWATTDEGIGAIVTTTTLIAGCGVGMTAAAPTVAGLSVATRVCMGLAVAQGATLRSQLEDDDDDW
jgi:RHS repeat-associated protein